MKTLPVVEIFGPTIQGEGKVIGIPTVFLRLGGCDYRCRWCDSMYAVDPSAKNTWKSMTVPDIIARIFELSRGPILVTLSGGNPALHNLTDLVAQGRAAGLRFAIETQGTLGGDWLRDVDIVTISPKPPSSGMTTNLDQLRQFVERCDPKSINFKIVVADDSDFQFVLTLANEFRDHQFWIQPCNPFPTGIDDISVHRQVLLEKLEGLLGLIRQHRAYHITILPQLHVLVWGNRKGV